VVEPADGGALKAADGSDLRRFQTLSARANCSSAATASSPGSRTTTYLRASAPRAAATFRARRLQIGAHIAFPWDGVLVATHPTLDRAGDLHIPNLDGLSESGWAAGHPESALGAGRPD
jgi:hypothetical protein